MRRRAWESDQLGTVADALVQERGGRLLIVGRTVALTGATARYRIELSQAGQVDSLCLVNDDQEVTTIRRRGGDWFVNDTREPALATCNDVQLPLFPGLAPAPARTGLAVGDEITLTVLGLVEGRPPSPQRQRWVRLDRTRYRSCDEAGGTTDVAVDETGLVTTWDDLWRERPVAWPDHASVLQVYPRSFADADGDGIGDLPGLLDRISYVSRLGTDAVWLNPFYPSPLADGGYDVIDPCDVDPKLGTLADLDAVVAALHEEGMALLIDVVPNHTSDLHPWFQASLRASPGSAERHRYLFREGQGDGPPNDWLSAFGGPAWTPTGDGAWYHHLHSAEQPDLNWDDPEVRREALRILAFWADRGIDGFRVDVANTLLKDVDSPLTAAELAGRPTDDGQHPLSDRAGLDDVYVSWRALLDSYDPPRVAVAEAAVSPARRARYSRLLGQAFDFTIQDADFDAAVYRRCIEQGLAAAELNGTSPTWLLGSHDTPRAATRFGFPLNSMHDARRSATAWINRDGAAPGPDLPLGRRRQAAAAALQLFVPGCCYVYAGEELGLPEVGDLPRDVLADPLARRSGGREKGRDGCRVPLPWARDRHALGGTSFGFGPGRAHLPQPDPFGALSVEAQDEDPASMLQTYRRLLRLRRLLTPTGSLAWHDAPGGVLHVSRPGVGGHWHCLTNFGTEATTLPPGRVMAATASGAVGELPPAASTWLLA